VGAFLLSAVAIVYPAGRELLGNMRRGRSRRQWLPEAAVLVISFGLLVGISVVPVSAAAAYRSPRSLCEGGNCDQNHVHQRK
jgi:hypothetical protein